MFVRVRFGPDGTGANRARRAAVSAAAWRISRGDGRSRWRRAASGISRTAAGRRLTRNRGGTRTRIVADGAGARLVGFNDRGTKIDQPNNREGRAGGPPGGRDDWRLSPPIRDFASNRARGEPGRAREPGESRGEAGRSRQPDHRWPAPTAGTDGRGRWPAPMAGTDGRHRRPAPTAATDGRDRRPAPMAATDGRHRRPRPTAGTGGVPRPGAPTLRCPASSTPRAWRRSARARPW
jgi:hypothetical protein